jgi:hypothetical protein
MLVRRGPRMRHPQDPNTSVHLGQRSRGLLGHRKRLLLAPYTLAPQAQRWPRLQDPSTSVHRGPSNTALRAPRNQSTLRWNSTPTS